MSLNDFNTRILPAKDKFYRFALKFMRDAPEAEDIVQEVLIKLWNQRSQFTELRNIEAWCMKMVRNQCLDRLKSADYKARVLSIHPETESQQKTPYQHLEMVDRMQMVRQLIESLPDAQKEVIHLRDVEGFSYQEVADITSLDMNRVKVYLFRARNTIKTKLLNAEAYGTR